MPIGLLRTAFWLKQDGFRVTFSERMVMKRCEATSGQAGQSSSRLRVPGQRAAAKANCHPTDVKFATLEMSPCFFCLRKRAFLFEGDESDAP